MGYSPTIGRWLETDPAEYIDGPNAYQMEDSNPTNGLDPTGLYNIDWYHGSGWQDAEKQKILASLGRVSARAKQLVDQINAYEQQLKAMKCDMSVPIAELEKLKGVMQKEVDGIASATDALEFVKKDLEKPDVPFQHHYYVIGTDNIEFNTTAKKMWDTLPSDDFDAGMLHELSHEYGTEDDDSKGVLMNAHNIAQLMNFPKDISRFSAVRGLVLDAQKKCQACGGNNSKDSK